MTNMLTRVNKTLSKTSKNNKGFSLIELIIVIAIMAALIAILAPQYLKYVEKSRMAADDSTANEILSAVQVAVADTDYSFVTGTAVATWTDGTITVTGTAANVGVLKTALLDSMGLVFPAGSDAAPSANIKSKTYKANANYIVTATLNANGTVTVAGAW
jgi:type IV pilus assembly protein PilA